MKGYSTKYALTQGIFPVEVRQHGDFVYTTDRSTQMKLGRDFFETREEAETEALRMAKTKSASLNKQIKNLEPLTRKAEWLQSK